MSIKINSLYIFLFMCTLCSCNESTVKDITPQNGIYIYKTNNEPVNGVIVDYFDDGKISFSLNFTNGIPNGESISYGHSGEVIGTTKHRIINKDSSDVFRMYDIERLCITNYLEGANEIVDLNVVFKQKSTINYDLIVPQLLDLLKIYDVDVKKIETIYFSLGELEPSFYEIKTANLRR